MLMVCTHHVLVCKAIPEYQTSESAGCRATARRCRGALRHLHAMMFRDDPAQQQCVRRPNASIQRGLAAPNAGGRAR